MFPSHPGTVTLAFTEWTSLQEHRSRGKISLWVLLDFQNKSVIQTGGLIKKKYNKKGQLFGINVCGQHVKCADNTKTLLKKTQTNINHQKKPQKNPTKPKPKIIRETKKADVVEKEQRSLSKKSLGDTICLPWSLFSNYFVWSLIIAEQTPLPQKRQTTPYKN